MIIRVQGNQREGRLIAARKNTDRNKPPQTHFQNHFKCLLTSVCVRLRFSKEVFAIGDHMNDWIRVSVVRPPRFNSGQDPHDVRVQQHISTFFSSNLFRQVGSPQWFFAILFCHPPSFFSSPTIFMSVSTASIYLILGLPVFFFHGGFMSVICLQGCSSVLLQSYFCYFA